MKALILAAGLGTRLRPLTNTIPKALLVVEGKPLLQHALEHVAGYGIRDIIINLHHFPELIVDFLEKHGNFGLNILFSDESDTVLETGGGLKKASWFFEGQEPFLVRNVDVLSSLDIGRMLQDQLAHRSLATLAIRKRESVRYFLFNDEMQLCGWENRNTGERRLIREAGSLNPFAFDGIQILSPEIFPLITETGKFSLTDLYLRLAVTHPITGFPDTGETWFSASSPDAPKS
ncbi:MAG: nucleotidyltransferase family protein [bacterium]